MDVVKKLRSCSLAAVLVLCGAKIALCLETHQALTLNLLIPFYCETSFVQVFHPALREMCGMWRFSFSSGKHYERREWIEPQLRDSHLKADT